MRLPSFLQRKDRNPGEAAAPVADEGQAVLEARTKARRRLIGAVALLGVGVVGFPLLFETQPRPLAADIPIEIVGKASAPPTAVPVRPPPPEPVSEPVPPPATVITERPGEAGVEVPPPKPAARPVAVVAATSAASTTSPVTASAPKAAAPAQKAAASAAKAEHDVVTPASMPAPAPVPRAATAPPAAHDDGARAQALLNGEPTASAGPAPAASAPARFVVQVGAYTDANALREARQKVEHLGLKTYTQEVESDTGKRTRVRVGPYATRKEAEAAAAKLKAAGLPTGLLAL